MGVSLHLFVSSFIQPRCHETRSTIFNWRESIKMYINHLVSDLTFLNIVTMEMFAPAVACLFTEEEEQANLHISLWLSGWKTFAALEMILYLCSSVSGSFPAPVSASYFCCDKTGKTPETWTLTHKYSSVIVWEYLLWNILLCMVCTQNFTEVTGSSLCLTHGPEVVWKAFCVCLFMCDVNVWVTSLGSTM